MPQAFRSRSGLHHLGGPLGSGVGTKIGECGGGRGGSKEDKAYQARYHDGEMELIPQGTPGPHANQVSAIGFIHQLLGIIGQRGPEKQEVTSLATWPACGRQHTAAPGKCFWKMGTSSTWRAQGGSGQVEVQCRYKCGDPD